MKRLILALSAFFMASAMFATSVNYTADDNSIFTNPERGFITMLEGHLSTSKPYAYHPLLVRQQMKLDYLQGLNDKYENWIKDYKGKLLIVEGDKIKFGDNPEDFRWITDRIDAELFGLFPFESEPTTGKEI